MSRQIRQTNLFYASSWKVIYQAFSNINFIASDYQTYKDAMVDYIRINYPEDFNDWIENSEFVMMIDLMAYLGQNLNYKIDLNARDNFIATAERQQSILNLAKMISYYPSRNYCSVGFIKIDRIQTSQEIIDSMGNSLKNVPILWNDETNPNWYEQFILVMNSAFLYNNSFGRPIKLENINGVETHLYQLNSVSNNGIRESFSSVVNGQSMSFEVINPDFTKERAFFEKEPNNNNSMFMLYRNDGSGNDSLDTGFFLMFKQGTLNFKDYVFQYPIENRSVDIDDKNVNQTDVWVQEITGQTAKLVQSWTPVSNMQNIVYNNLDRVERNIYKVETRANDTITVKFPDGRFGNIPVGTYRVWYRTSNNLRYRIKTRDMRNIQLSFAHKKNDGTNKDETFILSVNASLQYPVNNSIPSETVEQVQQRAPSVYYTQDRMVTGQDYNTYPLVAGNLIRKIKSINRTYAGHSRYIDINDPTGHYQSTNIFSEDGILYHHDFMGMTEELLPTNKSSKEIYDARIVPLMQSKDLINFFYNYHEPFDWLENSTRVKWLPKTALSYSMTGVFVDSTNADAPVDIGSLSTTNGQYITSGALIRLVNGATILPSDPGYKEVWVKIQSIYNTYPLDQISGAGPVVFSESLDPDETWFVNIFYPRFSLVNTQDEINQITTQIDLENTFGLRWDIPTSTWIIITEDNLDITNEYSLTYAGDTSGQNLDASWIIRGEYTSSAWRFYIRYLEYVFESEEDVRFFFDEFYKVNDLTTGRQVRDYIKVLRINEKISDPNKGLGIDYIWYLTDNFVYEDGYIEPRRVKLTMSDKDDDGVPDNPLQFEEIIETVITPTAADNRFVFWHKEISNDGYYYYIPYNDYVKVVDTETGITGAASVFYVIDFQTTGPAFKIWDGITITDPSEVDEYIVREGRKELKFQWRHFADLKQRIDPAPSNIIDNYVLTEQFYQDVLTWIRSTTKGDFPKSPDSYELSQTFNFLNDKKCATDELIWHSTKFKLLFGEGTISELKANFRVVKVSGVGVSDNEIKQGVISAIDTFFNIDNWDFGESFYYTELAAYIHNQMSSVIASVVVVPSMAESKFGNLFQIRCEENELFLSTATVQNVQIIDSLTKSNIHIGD